VALVSSRFFLRRSKMVDFLDDIEQLVESGSISVYIPHGSSNLEVEGLLKKVGVHPVLLSSGVICESAWFYHHFLLMRRQYLAAMSPSPFANWLQPIM